MPTDPSSNTPNSHPAPLGQPQSNPPSYYYNQQQIPFTPQHPYAPRNDVRRNHQRSRGAQQPFLYQGYTGYPAPGQQFPISQYQVYPTTAYNPYPMPPAQQQQPPNQRQSRQYQNPNSAMSQHQRHSQRIPPPPQKKKILAIFDPDTKEEVKVSRVDTPSVSQPPHRPTTPSTPVAIPQRSSQALELVEDPLDASSLKPDVSTDNASSEKSEQPIAEPPAPAVVQKQPSVAESLVSDTVTPDDVTPLAEAKIGDRTTSVTVDNATPASQDIADIDPERAQSIDAAVSDVSSGTPVDITPDPSDPTPEPVVRPPFINKVEISKPEPQSSAVEVPDVKPTPPVAPQAPPAQSNMKTIGVASETIESSSTHSVANPNVKDASVVREVKSVVEPNKTPVPAIVEKPNKETSPMAVDEKPTHPAEPTIEEKFRYKDGERRVYPGTFMADLRELDLSSRKAELEKILGEIGILKTSNPRNEQWTRNNRSSSGHSDTRRHAFSSSGGPGFLPLNVQRNARPPNVQGGLAAFNSFDMRIPRSQPPPSHRSSSSTRDGDLRGSKNNSRRSRFDGPTRQGPLMDPFNQPPVPQLQRSEKGWKRNRENDNEITAKIKTVRSLLNKLTLEKFDKITGQILSVGITSSEILIGIVKEIFEKALFEPKFAFMYANLCKRMDSTLAQMAREAPSDNNQPTNKFEFRKILLNNCKDEFVAFTLTGEAVKALPKNETEEQKKKRLEDEEKKRKEEEKLSPAELKQKRKIEKEEEDLKIAKAKRRMLANVTFIGELYLQDLISENVIHKHCVQKLLSRGIELKEEDVLEALSKLLSKTGAKLSSNAQADKYIDQYFNRLTQLSKDHSLSARIRFMLQDLIEQRGNEWKLRREEMKAKTIAEIHKDIDDKERKRADAENRQRDKRRGHGGSMHSRERSSNSFPPKMQMTMPPRQRTGSTISRSQALLDKHANRSGSGAQQSSLQGLRSRAGPPLGGLRPGSSSMIGSMGSFGVLSRESSLNGQSGDVRKSTKMQRAPSMPTSRRLNSEPANPPLQSARSADAAVSLKPAASTSMPESLEVKKRKVKNMLGEYWENKSNKEARECVEIDLTLQDYPLIVEELLLLSLEARSENIPKGIPLVVFLISELIPGEHFLTAFTKVVETIDDLDIDNPRASEFVGKYIGAVAATRKLPGGEKKAFGLDFLLGALQEVSDAKRKAKLMVNVLAQMSKQLEETESNSETRQNMVQIAAKTCGVDIASLMNGWNPDRGLSVLEDMLKTHNLEHVLPLLPVEVSFRSVLGSDGAKVKELLKSQGTLDEPFMAMVVRQSLDWVYFRASGDMKDEFEKNIGAPLRACFGENFAESVQIAALLEAQQFPGNNWMPLGSKLSENEQKEVGSVIFGMFRDSKIVSTKIFLQWKNDDGRSKQVGGKGEMLEKSSQFFKSL